MIRKFLHTQTKSISFASLILAGSYLTSAFLGFFRDHLLSGKLGAGNELDVYYTAFTVPDFIALILVFGAISAAIIPIFSASYAKSEEKAWEYVSNLLNIFLLGLVIICGLLIIFTPLVIKVIAPGFSEAKMETAILLMRIMFLSPIILGVSNIISGILQTFHRFLVTALAPLLYNIGIIIGIVFFFPLFGLPGLAMGVILGGMLHLLIQIPAFLHSGFTYLPHRQAGKKIFNFKNPEVIKTLKLMVPRSLGLGAGQVNTIAVTAIASTLAAGSISVFNLANNLSSFAVNAVAVSLSTAVFPAMARAHAAGNAKDFERKFTRAFLQSIFLTVPASILIFLLRAQIVRFIYGSGKFDWVDTRLTAACLGVFAFSLFAQGLVFLLSKTFYALHNTKIPAWISFATVVFNIVMSIVFVKTLRGSSAVFHIIQSLLKLEGIQAIGVIALAFAFSVTAIIEALVLLILLYKNYKVFNAKDMLVSLGKIMVAAAVMIVVTLFARQSLIIFNIVKLETVLGIFLQLAFCGVAGLITYVGVSYFLKSSELQTIKESFFGRKI